MRVTVHRKAHFNAAHRLYNKTWEDDKNESTFGKCNNPYYHGHNYELITSVTGEIDPETGYVMDMKILKDIIKEEVEDPFDHKNLNEQVSEFKEMESPEVEVKKPVKTTKKGPVIKSYDGFNPNGYNKVYNDIKELWLEGEFKQGQLWDGRLYVYDEDGLLLKIEVYKEGVFHSLGQL
jgi:6-pyruvoyltetrahydropterin/6-carboxytetrahydropterin synthase